VTSEDRRNGPTESIPMQRTEDVTEERSRTEGLTIGGKELVSTVKDLIRQGNIRRIAIVSRDEKTLIELPRTLGAAEPFFCRRRTRSAQSLHGSPSFAS
jgi:hypothetical protein